MDSPSFLLGSSVRQYGSAALLRLTADTDAVNSCHDPPAYYHATHRRHQPAAFYHTRQRAAFSRLCLDRRRLPADLRKNRCQALPRAPHGTAVAKNTIQIKISISYQAFEKMGEQE